MDRHHFIKNLVLVAITILLGFKLYTVWTKPLEIPITTTVKQTAHPQRKIEEMHKKKVNESDYDIIYKKNLFRPSRSPIKKESNKPSPAFSGEKPQLFGTVIMDNENLAIIEDPSRKKTEVYSLDDTILGFVITDILKDKVILVKGGLSIQLKLRAAKKFKPPKKKIRKKPRRRPRRRPRPRRSPTALRGGR